MKRIKFALLLIVILACFLRFYRLGRVPISLEWDEVALGYDAYSILKIGKDQFGQFFPINFRSLDDWKPPLYVYMAVPSVAIFGLTDFATRLPAAFFGVAAVVLTYYFVLELFPEKRERYILALLSSLFLAVSPWHLQFSRAAFETNLSVTVTLAAVLLFLKGISGRTNPFFLSAFFFGIALFSYHSTRVVTPILLVSLFLLFSKKLPSWKSTITFLIIYGVFVYFFIPIATNHWSQIRFLVTNDLDIAKYTSQSAEIILQEEDRGVEFVNRIFHNRRLSILNYENVKKTTHNYLTHFSPEFLFVKGDAPLHHAPGFGQMYFFDMVLLLIGILVYFFGLKNRRSFILIIWLFVAPLPAAITWQAPHSVRSEIILPTLQIISATGLIYLFFFIKKESRLFARLASIFFSILFLFGIGWYMHQYYFHTNIELSKDWMYGRKEAVELTEKIKVDYDKVLVSLDVDMPYIFWLYYTKYPPSKYLEEGGTVSGGFADERNKFDKYEFRNFDYSRLPRTEKILLVGIPKDFPPDVKVLKTIYYLDGTEALKIVENRQ